MAEITDEFIFFLEKNYRSLYSRVTAPDADKVTIDSIVSSMSDEFEIWKKIPQWIKNKYGDRIPRDVLNGVVPVKDYIVAEKEKDINRSESRKNSNKTGDLIDFSLKYVALGYSAAAAREFADNVFKRNQMRKIVGSGIPMSAEMREEWHNIRQSDIDIMRNDWIENQPEKYFFHLVKDYSRTEGKCENAASEQDKAKYAMKLSKLKTETRVIAERFSDMMQRRQLAEFLQKPNIQLAMSRLNPGAMDLFSNILMQKGIMVTRAVEEKEASRESVIKSFRDNYLRTENIVGIVRKRDAYDREFLGMCAGLEANTNSLSSLVNSRKGSSNDKN